MFIVSPLTIIQSYRTHNDYHRVSNVQRVASSKQASSRQHTQYPYEQTAYYRHAQAAAYKAESMLNSSPDTRLSSEKAYGNAQRDDALLKRYNQYEFKSQLQTYLPVPMTGLLVDRTM